MDNLHKLLLSELEKISSPLCIYIVEILTKRGKNGLHIKVVIDKNNGVTLNDCEKITRLFNSRLEILEPIEEENYTLEVSSPGTQREFKDKREYNIFKSRRVKVILKEPIEKGSSNTVLEGELEGMENDIISFIIDGNKLAVPLDKIKKTKLNG